MQLRRNLSAYKTVQYYLSAIRSDFQPHSGLGPPIGDRQSLFLLVESTFSRELVFCWCCAMCLRATISWPPFSCRLVHPARWGEGRHLCNLSTLEGTSLQLCSHTDTKDWYLFVNPVREFHMYSCCCCSYCSVHKSRRAFGISDNSFSKGVVVKGELFTKFRVWIGHLLGIYSTEHHII